MKISIPKKKYTFLVIPESGQAVVRFRLPRFILYAIPIVIVGLLATIYIMNNIHMSNLAVLDTLEKKLSLKESQMEMTIAHKNETIQEKNQTIEKLQGDIIALSQQADEVREKVAELRQLEEELRGLAGKPSAADANEDSSSSDERHRVHIASTSSQAFSFMGVLGNSAYIGMEDAYGELPHVGGVWVPLSDEQIYQMVSDTEMHFSMLGDELSELYDDLIEAKEEVLAYRHLQRITPSIWPTKSRKVTSSFGYRKDPFTGRPSHHTGIDIGGKYGDPVYATADGVVSFVGYDSSHGNNIIIDHSGGIKTRYMHLSKNLVKKGVKVTKGDLIGQIGSTGRSTGAHLHYEVIKNGKQVDPRPYMSSSGKDGK